MMEIHIIFDVKTMRHKNIKFVHCIKNLYTVSIFFESQKFMKGKINIIFYLLNSSIFFYKNSNTLTNFLNYLNEKLTITNVQKRKPTYHVDSHTIYKFSYVPLINVLLFSKKL